MHAKNKDQALVAASPHELALRWREQWRSELAAKAAEAAPAERASRAPKPKNAEFSTALARAEFGRHYFDASRYRQALHAGEVIWTERKRSSRSKGGV
jgi:hypothetical protein